MARRPPDGGPPILVALGVVATISVAVMFRAPPLPRARSGTRLSVPRAPATPRIDGEVDDLAWRGRLASTGVMPSVDGQPMTQSSVRLAWRGDRLYLLLYAADSDIRATVTAHDAPLWTEDAFRVAFRAAGEARARVLYVSPIGTLTDQLEEGGVVDTSWESGATVGHDLDGTPNDPRDDDEEWVIELEMPLASIGLRGVPGERVGFSARRCDAPKGAKRRCAAWGEPDGELELLP